MRRFFIALAVAAAVFSAGDASAQVKLKVVTPKVQVTQPVVKVPVKIIPPSMALSRAMSIAPKAQALNVTLKGPLYIVKLKEGSTIRKVRVNAATGAIAP